MLLSSLPFAISQDVFDHINQHQALALAPMHSSFYDIAKLKLYRNIHVYQPISFALSLWFGGPDRIPKQKFQYHKDINNIKSNKFTIISMKTLERYMCWMDPNQAIQHFELYGCHLVLIECILRHFHSIRYLQVILRHLFYWTLNTSVDICESIPGYLRACNLKTIFIFNQYTRRSRTRLLQPRNEKTSFYLPRSTPHNVIKLIDQLPNLTTLLMEMDPNVNYSNLFTNIKLRKLSIKNFLGSREADRFIIDEIFDTKNLQKLIVLAHFRLHRLFSVFELDRKYPRLALLCLEYQLSLEDERYIKEILKYGHKTLAMLTVIFFKHDIDFATTLCSLSPNFPVTSVKWWQDTSYWELHDEFSEKIIIMSPTYLLEFCETIFWSWTNLLLNFL